MKRLLLVVAAAAAFLLSAPSFADVTFGASVTNANGTLSPRLTWSTNPVADGCTAAGHPSWTGAKAASGAFDLPPITQSGTYTLTLSCTRAGVTTARVTWQIPSTNTDGTALARCATPQTTGPCLHGFRVYRSANAQIESPAMVEVENPNQPTYLFQQLTAGPHFFAVEAVNGNGVPSVLSNVATKTIAATAVENAGVTLTVNPIPRPPTALIAE